MTHPTRTHLGEYLSVNHPCRIMSDQRAHSWRDFTVLLIVWTALCFGWVVVGGWQV